MARRGGDPMVDPTSPEGQAGTPATSHRLWLTALGLALILGAVAAGTTVVASGMSTRPATISAPASTPEAIAPPPPPTGHPAVVPPHQPPVRVSVPRVGIDAPVKVVGLNADGTLKVPDNDEVAGWYGDGPVPGDTVGPPAVIAGHVDSYLGPAVFFALRQVRPNDEVLVQHADGSVARFVVYRVARFAKTAFPADQVYAPGPRAELRLITCTGVFDYDTRSYLSDFVVYAALQPTAPEASSTPAG